MNAQTEVKPSHANIAAALAAAQMQMSKAEKSAENPGFKRDGKNLRYADLASVMDACMAALNKNGIAVIQPAGEDDAGRFVETVLIHECGEKLSCRVPLIIGKNDMQGYGSAVTYARRYGLMCMAGIAPDDDDGNAAVAVAPPRQERRPDPRQESRQSPADDMAAFSALVDATTFAIGKQPTVDALNSYWRTLDAAVKADERVIKAGKDRKAELSKPLVDDSLPYEGAAE